MEELRAKNHYVPELYLKQWQDESNKVCAYRILVSHINQPLWKKYATGAIAFQKHLYTQVISGAETDELERWIDSNYESPAKDVIDKVTSDSMLSRNDWEILIRFLACQDVRTPARLIEHLKRDPAEINKILKDSLEDIKYEIENNTDLPEELSLQTRNIPDLYPIKTKIEQVPNSEMVRINVESYIGRATWIHSIRYLLDNTAQVLHSHKWSIIKPADGYSWFTSDNPVVKLNFKDNNNYNFGGGWGREKGNIIFPIGPRHAMFAQIGDKPPLKGTMLNEQLTKNLQKFIAENAHRMIFSNHFEDDIALLRPRTVDDQAVIRERQQLENWHEKNKTLESEYLR